ncbi:MAG TPA: ECF-type sigma factor [Phycisphaerales bacterium]|nr:ECF-type sigma factor [Phycisphaerales bacterium]
MSDPQSQLTVLLQAASSGDDAAAGRVLPLIYNELRQMAGGRLAGLKAGQTLQATALVHEAYIKLVRSDASWESRAHFFGAAARAMRDIMVDRARARGRLKRGGDRARVGFDEGLAVAADADDDTVDLVGLDAALNKLAEHDKRAAEVVMLRFFAGLDIEQTAQALGVSVPTVNRDWRYARAFLASELGGGEDP